MAGVADASRGRRGARFALVAVVLAFAVISVAVATARSASPTTYGATSTAAAIVDLVAGVGAIAAGCLAIVVVGRASLAAVMMLIGVSWLAADWIGWEAGPTVARSVAMIVAPFVVPLLLHLVLAYPSGRLTGGRPGVALVAAAYGITAIASVGLALFRDPFRDLHCWRNCSDNVFLLRPDRDLTRIFDALGWRAAVAIGVIGTIAAAVRLAAATPVARRATWFVLVPATAALATAAAYAAAVLTDPAGEPDGHFRTIYLLLASSVGATAFGFAWGVVRSHRTGRAIARLAAGLGSAPAPGTFGATLADSFGDDRLVVAYRMSGSGRYVDASGRRADPQPDHGQVTTAIVRGGQPLAVVVHDRALVDEHDLEREIGAAARLAVDNERLRAETLAQLEDLRVSRARLVVTADETRRRLERDLHDGAQQRLLAVLYELRLASGAAVNESDHVLRSRLDQLSQVANQTLAELRELAHGIYPAILVEAGLGAALRTFADRAPIAVELEDVGDDRLAADVEAAAYLVVAETISDAASNGSATAASVRVRNGAEAVVVEVDHDGRALSADVGVHLADRVGALGGLLVVDETMVRAELPCAS